MDGRIDEFVSGSEESLLNVVAVSKASTKVSMSAAKYKSLLAFPR